MARRSSKKSTGVARSASAKKSIARKSLVKASDSSSASENLDLLIEDLGDWRGAFLATIRKLIHEVDPAIVEEWKWMGSPVWSHDGICIVGNAHKDKVKLTFYHGAELRDPGHVFNAGLDGNKWRAIDLHEESKLNKTALKALLREAVAYNVKLAEEKSKRTKRPANVVKKKSAPAKPSKR